MTEPLVEVTSNWVLNRIATLPDLEKPTYRSVFDNMDYAYIKEGETEFVAADTDAPSLFVREDGNDWADISHILCEDYHLATKEYEAALAVHPTVMLKDLYEGLTLHIPYSMYLLLLDE